MEKLSKIVDTLDCEFKIEQFGKDPAFSRFVPNVYNDHLNWEEMFEPKFNELFNGLMIKGSPVVHNLYLAVFPTTAVMEHFIQKGVPGDLLFMHHPLLMKCGDPYGKWGEGFVPVEERLLKQVREKGLSIYTCHAPMDYHQTLGTSQALAEAVGVEITNRFIHNEEYGDIGVIGKIDPLHTSQLIDQLKSIFDIPYVDFEGDTKSAIQKVAIVAGCGDKTKWMVEAERQGVEAYISGEIHCHIDNEYGRKRYQEIKDYAGNTHMSLIGVSHSASEYIVKKTLLYQWFKDHFHLDTINLIPQETWWL